VHDLSLRKLINQQHTNKENNMNTIDEQIGNMIAATNNIERVYVSLDTISRTREVLESYLVDDFSEISQVQLTHEIVDAIAIEKMATGRGMKIDAAVRDFFTLQSLRPVK